MTYWLAEELGLNLESTGLVWPNSESWFTGQTTLCVAFLLMGVDSFSRTYIFFFSGSLRILSLSELYVILHPPKISLVPTSFFAGFIFLQMLNNLLNLLFRVARSATLNWNDLSYYINKMNSSCLFWILLFIFLGSRCFCQRNF